MSNLFTRCSHSLLLTGVVTGSILLCFAQTQTAPAASSAAPAKATAPAAGKQTTEAVPTLATPKEKLSYALGMDVGRQLKAASVDVDPAILARGVIDTLTGSKTLMTDEELHAFMVEFQAQLRQKQVAMAKERGDKNKKEGAAFLAENKTKEGVIALPSGLEYKVLKAGEGPKPTAADTVMCNYRGTLIDGKEFDSSYKRNQPATFPVTGVIKGWTEALQLMPVGSKWQLFVPSELAYGERGAAGAIEPNATLIFEVELLSIQPKGKDSQTK
jgi:FKBP-type peptidyl-prolyl cis-trans isomerase